jgi:hypothetical protein
MQRIEPTDRGGGEIGKGTARLAYPRANPGARFARGTSERHVILKLSAFINAWQRFARSRHSAFGRAAPFIAAANVQAAPSP